MISLLAYLEAYWKTVGPHLGLPDWDHIEKISTWTAETRTVKNFMFS